MYELSEIGKGKKDKQLTIHTTEDILEIAGRIANKYGESRKQVLHTLLVFACKAVCMEFNNEG